MKRISIVAFLCLIAASVAAQDINSDRLLRMRDSLDHLLMINPTSSAILVRKGEVEFYSFNTLMSNKEFNDREGKPSYQPGKYSLFNSLLQINYGLSRNRRINIGADVSYRSYRFDPDKNSSTLKVFSKDGGATFSGLNYAGLRIRVVPFAKLKNFTWQSYFWLPTAPKDVQYTLGSYKSNFGNTLFYYKYFTPRIGIFLQANITLAIPTGSVPTGANSFTELYLPLSASLSYVVTRKDILFGSAIYSWVNDDARNFTEGADHDFGQFSIGYQRVISKRFFANLSYTGTVFSRNYGEWNSVSFGIRYLY